MRDSHRCVALTIVAGMRKRTPAAGDASTQLARMERLCLALDDVRAESDRLYSEITTKARQASSEVLTGELARGLVRRTFERGTTRRQRPRLPRDRAD